MLHRGDKGKREGINVHVYIPFTDSSSGLPARELHLCGHECAAGLVRRMVESVEETVEVSDRGTASLPLS